MSLTEHIENALSRMETAERKIRAVRDQEASPENLQAWLGALSDYVLALGDVHELDREQLDGHLHDVAQRIGLERVAPRARFIRGR